MSCNWLLILRSGHDHHQLNAVLPTQIANKAQKTWLSWQGVSLQAYQGKKMRHFSSTCKLPGLSPMTFICGCGVSLYYIQPK